MGQIVLDYPSHLRIELVQGCTRACHSCPADHKKENIKVMEDDVFQNVLKNIDERVKRIEFSMHGEPLLNPSWISYVEQIRLKSPKTQISIISNADILTKAYKSLNKLIDAFDRGLNFIHVDVYDKKSKELFVNLIVKNKPVLAEHGIIAQKFVKGGINIWSYHKAKNKHILMSDESLGFNVAGKHVIRNIHTWAGNLPYDRWKKYSLDIKQFPMQKKCTEPMKCLPIDIYGRGTLCCADFAKSIIYGDLNKQSMHEIWNGETIQKVRYLLSRGLRDHIPACFFCNRPSFRVGLWPYKGPELDENELYHEMYTRSYMSETLANLFEEYNK